jgi:hypothetical protein
MVKLGLFTAMVCLALPARPAQSAQETSPLGEVVSMLRAEVPEEAVRAYVEIENMHFHLTSDDLVSLTQAGAGADFLLFLLDRSRREGSPTPADEVEVVYESKGFRLLRQKDDEGQQVLVLTNIDENGHRMDSPPAIEEQPLPSEPDRAPLVAEEFPVPIPPPTPPATEERAFAPTSPRRQNPRARVYFGPFYQLTPSNVPGPGSPWSPVFQVVPVWRYPLGVPVYAYPFAQLAPVFPPGFPLHPSGR